MILEFKITNFGSVQDTQTLSFEATKDRTLEEYYVVEVAPNVRVLKMGVIYGANASGKTMILRGLEFLRTLILSPLTDKTAQLNYTRFAFSEAAQKEDSKIELTFYIEAVRYVYSVAFNPTEIVSEMLNYSPNGRVSLFFERHTEGGISRLTFGNSIEIGQRELIVLEGNTLRNNTVWGGFSKSNVNVPKLQAVFDWFKTYVGQPITPDTDLFAFTTERVESSDIFKQNVVNLMSNADVQIDDIDVVEMDSLPQQINGSVNGDLRKTFSENGHVKQKQVLFQHNLLNDRGIAETYFLPSDMESQGTQRYYGLSGVLTLLINKSSFLSIDELETSLHPELMKHFVLTFLANARRSQLLFTTHNVHFLDEKDILRNDAVWFTQKRNEGSTELYSLSDFDTKAFRKGLSIINAYKVGKLGAKPYPSSIFLMKSATNGKTESQ